MYHDSEKGLFPNRMRGNKWFYNLDYALSSVHFLPRIFSMQFIGLKPTKRRVTLKQGRLYSSLCRSWIRSDVAEGCTAENLPSKTQFNDY